jgi:uncharacterized membrane protein
MGIQMEVLHVLTIYFGVIGLCYLAFIIAAAFDKTEDEQE